MQENYTPGESLAIALKAVDLYASAHPRPTQVSQKQAAEMLNLSVPTIRKMVKAGTLRINLCGLIPISEVDKVLRAS